MKLVVNSLSVLQIFIIGYGIYLLRMAENAMDKTGIGDVNLWSEYNSEAGVLLSISTVIWVFALVTVFISKQYILSSGKVAVLMPPSLFFIGWVSLWYI